MSVSSFKIIIMISVDLIGSGMFSQLYDEELYDFLRTAQHQP